MAELTRLAYMESSCVRCTACGLRTDLIAASDAVGPASLKCKRIVYKTVFVHRLYLAVWGADFTMYSAPAKLPNRRVCAGRSRQYQSIGGDRADIEAPSRSSTAHFRILNAHFLRAAILSGPVRNVAGTRSTGARRSVQCRGSRWPARRGTCAAPSRGWSARQGMTLHTAAQSIIASIFARIGSLFFLKKSVASPDEKAALRAAISDA
jgi:hypothetical protein